MKVADLDFAEHAEQPGLYAAYDIEELNAGQLKRLVAYSDEHRYDLKVAALIDGIGVYLRRPANRRPGNRLSGLKEKR